MMTDVNNLVVAGVCDGPRTVDIAWLEGETVTTEVDGATELDCRMDEGPALDGSRIGDDIAAVGASKVSDSCCDGVKDD